MKFPCNLGNDTVIIKNGSMIDVFFGKEGWTPHARFQVKQTTRGKFLTSVGGDKVPPAIFKQVISHVGV